MVKETKDKVYPDHTLENELRKRGIDCRCMWEHKGPSTTSVAWIVCYLVNGMAVLVETFSDGGWNAFTGCESGRIDDTVDDVIQRSDWNDVLKTRISQAA